MNYDNCNEKEYGYVGVGGRGNLLMEKMGDPKLLQISLDELHGRMAGVSQQIDQNTALTVGTSETVLKTGAAVQHQLNEVERKMDMAFRKKRHKKVGSQIATVATGEISLISTFDDGEQEIVPFIINVKGEIQIAKICFPDLEWKTQYFAVGFPCNTMMIILEEHQIKPRNLYLEFIASGVQFNPVLRKNQIEDALFSAIAPRARYALQKLFIPARNGWFQGRFFSEDEKCKELERLPLLRKRMVTAELTAEAINLYFAEMRQICSPRNRILIALTPFAGLLGSLLCEGGFTGNVCLNFVEIKKGMKHVICSWEQVYERETLVPKRVSTAQSKNEKCMGEIKDGVIIFDGTCNEGSGYEKSMIQSNLAKIAQITTGESTIGNKSAFATVLISSQFLRQRGVFDLVFDEAFWHETDAHLKFVKSQTLEAVLNSFVRFIEKNQRHILELIDRRKKSKDQSFELLDITHEIIQKFWQSYGTDFDRELCVPNMKEIKNLFFENAGLGDLMEDFVSAVRKNISLFQLSQKQYGAEYTKFTIVYDQEFLWIPSVVLKKMVSIEGLLPELSKILFNLKESQELICDFEGFTRRIQIGGKRGEYYQFRLEFFNRTGSAEIVELGREIE